MKPIYSWRERLRMLACRIAGHKPRPGVTDAPMTICDRCGLGVPKS